MASAQAVERIAPSAPARASAAMQAAKLGVGAVG